MAPKKDDLAFDEKLAAQEVADKMMDFTWASTEEGHVFWSDIHKRLLRMAKS